MIARNCGATVPDGGDRVASDASLLEMADALPERVRRLMSDYQPHMALVEIWKLVSEANRYFAAEEPWRLAKTEPTRMGGVLYVTAEVLRTIGILLQPFIPQAAAKLLDNLGAPSDRRLLSHAGQGGRLSAGAALPAPAPLFPRYVEKGAG
jgi:methionyl-tRNA synthetase